MVSEKEDRQQITPPVPRLKKYDEEKSELSLLYRLQQNFWQVPPHLLLSKVASFGIGGSLLKLLKNYLNNRKQFVKINSKSTLFDIPWCPLRISPGPLLLLISMNDLTNSIENWSPWRFQSGNWKSAAPVQWPLPYWTEVPVNRASQESEKKCKLLPVKGHFIGTLKNREIENTNCQPDVGHMMSSTISWT